MNASRKRTWPAAHEGLARVAGVSQPGKPKATPLAFLLVSYAAGTGMALPL